MNNCKKILASCKIMLHFADRTIRPRQLYLEQFIYSSEMILLSIISTSTICVWTAYLYIKCQNLSQKICFTAAKHSGAKNGRFRALERRRQMKNRAAKDEDLHTGPTFVHVFCSIFATFRVSVSTPNFQKSTPNFQKALTFKNRGTPFFEKQAQATDFQ